MLHHRRFSKTGGDDSQPDVEMGPVEAANLTDNVEAGHPPSPTATAPQVISLISFMSACNHVIIIVEQIIIDRLWILIC